MSTAEHVITTVEYPNGTFGWECSCGDEERDYGGVAAAEDDADDHCQTAN